LKTSELLPGHTNIGQADLASAVASILREEPMRILALASRLRGPGRVLESVVQGISMGRTLAPGSTIRIELAERPTYRVGDVVAVLVGRRLIVHRLVYRGNSRMAHGFLLTRGDANLIPDAPVPEANVLGPVMVVRNDADWLTLQDRPRRSRGGAMSALFLLVVIVALRINPKSASTCVSLLRRWETKLRSKFRKSWMRKQSSSGRDA
jgi:hypothetical protein